MTATATIAQHFADLKDPRVERTKLYPLLDILIIALCALICGAEGWEDMQEWGEARLPWLREHLGLELPHGIPTDDTFRRVFSKFGSLMPSRLAFWPGFKPFIPSPKDKSSPWTARPCAIASIRRWVRRRYIW